MCTDSLLSKSLYRNCWTEITSAFCSWMSNWCVRCLFIFKSYHLTLTVRQKLVSFRLSLIEHKPMGVSVELGINVTGHRVLNVYSINWGSVIPRIISRVVFRIFSSSEIKPVTILCNIGNICNSPTLGCYSRFKTEFKIEKKNNLSALQMINSLKNLQPFALVPIILILNLGDIAMFLERTGYVAYVQCKWSNRNTIS